MLIRKIQEFRENTRKRYQMEEEKRMEPWKKKVRKLHEEAEFLCYVNEVEREPDSLLRFLIQGELVKGNLEIGSFMYLFDGQGQYLGEAQLYSDLEEKEEKRLGMIRMKRNQFILKMSAIQEDAVEKMEVREYQRQMEPIMQHLSLLTDCHVEK